MKADPFLHSQCLCRTDPVNVHMQTSHSPFILSSSSINLTGFNWGPVAVDIYDAVHTAQGFFFLKR